MAEQLVRLENDFGADEANVCGVSYRIRPDGGFLVPADHANMLVTDGSSGFVIRCDLDAQIADIRLAVSVLPPGHARDVLSAALSTI